MLHPKKYIKKLLAVKYMNNKVLLDNTEFCIYSLVNTKKVVVQIAKLILELEFFILE